MSNALTQEGRLTAATQILTLSLAGDAGAMVQIADTFTGTLAFLATADGQNYVPMAGTPIVGGTGVTTATAGGIWTFSVGGLLALRVSATALSAGAARVTMRAVEASGGGGGGGGGTALLPTAPLNQVLISQGAGVQPIFANVVPVDLGAFTAVQGVVWAGAYVFTTRNAAGVAEHVGDLVNIADSTTNVWGATITGGGALNVLGRWNGTAFTVVGK
jgi:hypothetical protein